MKHTSSRTVLAVATVFLLGAASACGDDDDDATDTTAAAATDAPAGTEAPAATEAPEETEATEAPAGSAAPAGSEAPAAGAATVMTAEGELGTHLVDGEGMTLYMFLPDAQGPSTCEGDCLAAWPALAGPATAGEGADESLLGTAARPDDGTEQVTYNGWPLYYFAQDAAPGDVNGQGLGDNWWVVSPAGEAISGT